MTTLLHAQIPPGSNYSDGFWDDQFKGVDILFNKLKNSKMTSEEIRRLYQSRAHIEQEYGEKLLKLAATTQVGKQEYGSFAETLSSIPSTLETTARAHIDLAQQLKDHLELPLNGFLKEQRELRKKHHEQIENLKQLKNLHQNEVLRAKDYYLSESEKLMTLETSVTTEMKKEIEEQRQMVIVAEQMYKRSIDNLNTVNEKWINDWKRSAEIYQEMEIKRVTYLRSTLWSFSNIIASTLNVDEECCNRIRTALEITDVEKDIIDFVRSHGTGTKIPSPASYEKFHTKLKKNLESHQASEESLPHSITVLTNPDEELKSVEQQLQQLEQSQSPRAEMSPDLLFNTKTTTHPEPVLPAIKIENNQSPYRSEEDLKRHSKQSLRNSMTSNELLKLNHELPFDQPSAKLGDTTLVDKVYEKSTTSPKDEKWVYSSARRQDQHTTPNTANKTSHNTPVHQHKPRKPVVPLKIDIPNSVNQHSQPAVPLTIDIPNSVNQHPQLAAHQAIEYARRHSQMSPISQKKMEEHGGIRLAPWQENGIEKKHMYPQPDTSANLQEDIKNKKSKNRPESAVKSAKETKGIRFSHFFNGGNKKEKKKNQKQSIPEHHPIVQPTRSNPIINQHPVQPDKRFVCYAKAQWPFEATIESEMSVNQNETLGIIHKQMDGWWQAERLTSIAAGKKGLVPGNYMVDASPI